MLIQKLDIQEFRGIKKCKNPINLSNFTVLIGRNNSGKSTILEALSLLPNPLVKDYITEKHKIQFLIDLHRSDPRNKETFKSLLYLYDGRSTIDYRIQSNKLEIRITRNDSLIRFNGELLHNSVVLNHFFEVIDPNLTDSVLYIPNDSSVFLKMEVKIQSLKERIMKKGYNTFIAESLNKCIDDKYSELVFLEPISIRKILPDKAVYIELRDLGSGAEKAVKIMSLIEAVSPKLLLIDDIEAGFHPSLTKMIITWLKNKNWQTVLSTHSLDTLYYLLEVRPNDATIIQLYKSEDDILDYRSLGLDDIEDLLDANTDPRLLSDALGL